LVRTKLDGAPGVYWRTLGGGHSSAPPPVAGSRNRDDSLGEIRLVERRQGQPRTEVHLPERVRDDGPGVGPDRHGSDRQTKGAEFVLGDVASTLLDCVERTVGNFDARKRPRLGLLPGAGLQSLSLD